MSLYYWTQTGGIPNPQQALEFAQQAKANAATSITYASGGQVTCNDTGPTNVSAISAATITGQRLTIIAYTGNTTITTAAAKLKGNVNATLSANSTLSLTWDGTNWFETGRSF